MADTSKTLSATTSVIASRQQVSEPGHVISVQRVTGSQQQRESISKALQHGQAADTLKSKR